jgi:hypothetical protein
MKRAMIALRKLVDWERNLNAYSHSLGPKFSFKGINVHFLSGGAIGAKNEESNAKIF